MHPTLNIFKFKLTTYTHQLPDTNNIKLITNVPKGNKMNIFESSYTIVTATHLLKNKSKKKTKSNNLFYIFNKIKNNPFRKVRNN